MIVPAVPNFAIYIERVEVLRTHEPEHLLKPSQVVHMLKRLRLVPDDGREHFGVFTLGNANNILSFYSLSIGSATECIVEPRDVYGAALRSAVGATSVIVVHNHPDGRTTPSAHDYALTQRLVEAGRLLEIELLEHIVFAHGSENRAWDYSVVPKSGFHRQRGRASRKETIKK